MPFFRHLHAGIYQIGAIGRLRLLLIGGGSTAVIVLTSIAGLSSVDAWGRVAMLAGAAFIGGVAAVFDARERDRESSSGAHAADAKKLAPDIGDASPGPRARVIA